jgi:hypothetical protein
MYSDPKRPKNIIYSVNKKSQDEVNGDFYQLISMVFGIVSFIFKVN